MSALTKIGDGVEDGIAEYSAVHEFASPLEALDAAAALGAHGRMFEWPGELDYMSVDDTTRQWLLAGSDAAGPLHEDQLSMF